MPEQNPPTTPGATPGQGQQPGAGGNTGQLISQGPNDPINPQQPGTGSSGGSAQQPGTGAGSGNQGEPQDPTERRLANLESQMERYRRERDDARTELETERRKALPPEEQTRLKGLDEQVKAQQARERNLTLRYEIAARAPKLGIVDPELAVLLLEKKDTVQVDEAGNVTGLDEALKALVKERPHLVRATSQPVDAGAGNAGRGNSGKAPGMNEIIRGAARGTKIVQGD